MGLKVTKDTILESLVARIKSDQNGIESRRAVEHYLKCPHVG